MESKKNILLHSGRNVVALEEQKDYGSNAREKKVMIW